MHLCKKSMHRMLVSALIIVCALVSSIAIVPQAHANALPSLTSLIAEEIKDSLVNQMRIERIDDDPTPLANLLAAGENAVLEKAADDSKLEAFVDPERASDFYFSQEVSGRCTITSVAMMLRRAAFLDDSADWQNITLASTMADGWTAAGVKNNFSSAGYDVSLIDLSGSTETLVALLDEHPEGVAIYDRSLPHAVLLTDYDVETGTFYCADPANYYAGKRIPLAESWNGECHGKSQDAAVANISGAWIIN